MAAVKPDEAERLSAWERREHDAATGRYRRLTENTTPQALTPTRLSDEPRKLCIEGALHWTYCDQLETVTRYRTHADAAEIDAAVERLGFRACPCGDRCLYFDRPALIRRHARVAGRPDDWRATPDGYEPAWIDRPDYDFEGLPKRGSFIVIARSRVTRKGREVTEPSYCPIRRVGGVDDRILANRAAYACWWDAVMTIAEVVQPKLKTI